MAIDPWVYASGTPPANGTTPLRSRPNISTSQGFESFMRSSLDQAQAGRQTSVSSLAAPAQSQNTQRVVRVSIAQDPSLNRTAKNPADQAQQTELTPDEESMLKAVAAIQAKRVKTSSPQPHSGYDKPLAFGKKAPGLDAKPSEVAAAATAAGAQGAATPAAVDTDKVASTATSQMGKRYVSGGASPKSGFDCSGFTNWVYGEAGVDIARNSRQQYQEGQAVSREQLQKGDLVFFGSKKRVNHVGIYLGEGQFIHSTSSGGTVRVSSLDDPVWTKSYAGGRRVTTQSAANTTKTDDSAAQTSS